MLIVKNPYFILIVLKQINAVVCVIILMIPMQKKCVPDIAKNLNIKVFNLISMINETRPIKWHGACKCK